MDFYQPDPAELYLRVLHGLQGPLGEECFSQISDALVDGLTIRGLQALADRLVRSLGPAIERAARPAPTNHLHRGDPMSENTKAEAVAASLNGREYGEEHTREEARESVAAASRDYGVGFDAIIEALTIFRKYGNPACPFHCTHDTLTICEIEPSEVSAEDRERLDVLGFFVGDEGAFESLRWGRC